MAESSPAVERAQAAADSMAASRGDSVRLADWLVSLLQDDWGKPAELLGRIGLEPEAILLELAKQFE